MKKTLAIVTFYTNSGEFYYNTVKKLFGNELIIKRYSFDDGSIEKGIEADLILISSYSIFGAAKKYVKSDNEIIIINTTLSKEGFNKLMDLEKNTKAMLVNVSDVTAMETISLIYQLGIKHIDLVPVYPGINSIPNLNTAITPGELKHVPKFVDRLIDIGDRLLDISTIVDIAVKLNMESVLKNPKIRKYFKEMIPISFGLEKIMGKSNILENQLNSVLQILDEGILCINADGIIYSYNESAQKLLGHKKEDVIGNSIEKLLPEIPYENVLKSSRPIKEKLIKINNNDFIVTITPIINLNTLFGVVVMLKKFSDIEEKQHKFRTQLIGNGHRAKYTFDDIKGNSVVIKKCKDIAKIMAKSDSSILITGESGTGKELFAQAIHNFSNRSHYQFVAVNCAALPENLLESELFGYEEGAFTGAKKGGKLGLFELAHKGTLFLDEIGEMSVRLQARLLRVLQERQVMRIGGDRIINIDVRIIAATNRDLKELVKKGDFRGDLYYRLNVLPLNIPPLRERKEDILLLIDEFKNELNFQFDLTESAKNVLIYHYWEGNIRELRNYVEYFGCLNKKVIDVGDIPFGMEKNISKDKISEKEEKVIARFKQEAGEKLAYYLYVLDKLEESYINSVRIGRRSIANLAKNDGVYLSEQEIRRIFKDLEKYNLVHISKGRGGTKITELGIKALNRIKG